MACIVAALLPLASNGMGSSSEPASVPFPGWAQATEQLPFEELVEVPLMEGDSILALNLPGRMARFQAGDQL